MKKIVTYLLSVILLSTCFFGMEAKAAQYNEEELLEALPIYPLLVMDEETEEVAALCDCFVVGNEEGRFLITTHMIGALSEGGYYFLILTHGQEMLRVDAHSTQGYVTVLKPERNFKTQAFPFGENINFDSAVGVLSSVVDENAAITYDSLEVDKSMFQQNGDFYKLVADLGDDGAYYGSPMIDAVLMQAVGMIASDGEGMGIAPIASLNLPKDASIGEALIMPDEGTGTTQEPVKEPVEEPAQEPVEEPAQEPVQEPAEEPAQTPAQQPAAEPVAEAKPEENSTVYWVVGAGVLAAVCVKISKQKKKENGDKGIVTSSGKEGTVHLEPELEGTQWEPEQDEPGISPKVSDVGEQYVLVGVAGVWEGKEFRLGAGILMGRNAQSCSIAFPEGTPGVSGTHCKISCEGGQIILTDLNSTYGTWMDGEVRLEAGVEYHLQEGDIFYLGGKQQAFRIGRQGEAMKETYQLAVKALTGELQNKTYYLSRGGSLKFGRGDSCQVLYSGASRGISSLHCEITWLNGKAVLIDRTSTNGTFFGNKAQLRPETAYELQKGTRFFLVDESNTFEIVEYLN